MWTTLKLYKIILMNIIATIKRENKTKMNKINENKKTTTFLNKCVLFLVDVILYFLFFFSILMKFLMIYMLFFCSLNHFIETNAVVPSFWNKSKWTREFKQKQYKKHPLFAAHNFNSWNRSILFIIWNKYLMN